MAEVAVVKSLGVAILASGLVMLLLAASFLTTRAPQAPGSFAPDEIRWGLLAGLPASATLVVSNPVRDYDVSDVADIASFVGAGGRLLVTHPSAAAAGLLRGLGSGIEIGAPVFDPDTDDAQRTLLIGAGELRSDATTWVARPTVLHGGEPLLVTGPFVWEDRDDDRIPDIDEPRGLWSVAVQARSGAGYVIVLGHPDLLGDPILAPLLQGWGDFVVLDAGHQTEPDVFGVTGALSGQAPAALVVLPVAVFLLGVGVALRMGIQRRTPRRGRRHSNRDVEALAALGELEA